MHNIKNLMWYFRCLPCHPDNIKTIELNGVNYYYLTCNKKSYAMKGFVACDVWSKFIKKLTDKIQKYEKE